MKNKLLEFGQLDFYGTTFNVYGDNCKTFIRLSDVCLFLGHSAHNIGQHVSQLADKLDDSEKTKAYQDGSQSPVPVWFVTVNGLWELIYSSRMPVAQAIKSGFIQASTLITIEQIKQNADTSTVC